MTRHIIFTCLFFLSACVLVEKPNINDETLRNASCQELQKELVRVGGLRRDAEQKQGVTGTQIAAGLLLGGIGMAVNEERAKSAAKDSKVALKKIYTYWDAKHCDEEVYKMRSISRTKLEEVD